MDEYQSLLRRGHSWRNANSMQEMNEPRNIIADMEATIEKLIAERDSAIKDLKSISEDTGDGCQFCKHLPCMPDPGYCLGWEYKGLEKIGEGVGER